jgi:hypothetical protein
MLAKIRDTMLLGAVGSAALAIPVMYFALGIGGLYWLWLAIQFGSFGMFVLGVAGPLVLFTAPVGLYALLFGVPHWLLRLVT